MLKDTLTIAIGQTDSNAFVTEGQACGTLALPAAFDGTAISFKVHNAATGSFEVKRDWDNNIISIPVTAGCNVDIPGEIFSSPFAKVVSNAGGGESAARSIGISLGT